MRFKEVFGIFGLILLLGVLAFLNFTGNVVLDTMEPSFSGQVEDFSAVFDNDSSTFAVVGDGAVMDFSYAFKSERIYLKLDAREGYYDISCLSNDSEYVFIERVNGSFDGELDLPSECGDLKLKISYFVYDNVSEDESVNDSGNVSEVSESSTVVRVVDNSSIVEGNVTSEENSSAVVESNETVADNSSTVEGNNDSVVSEDNSTVEEGINEGGEVVGENVTGEESVGENSSEETFSASVEEEIVEGEIVEEEGVVEENSGEVVEGETIITGEVIEGGYGEFYEIKVYGVEESFGIEEFSTSFSGAGNGTDEDPFQITTCDELNETRNNLTASYILMNDINFSACDASYTTGEGWDPIGNQTSGYMFAGNFDGQNYTIYDLYINRPTEDYVGLFGYVESVKYFEYINLVSVNISGADFTGGLGGYMDVEITNIFVEGVINGGSLVGLLSGGCLKQILNSSTSGEVNGSSQIGGLVGSAVGAVNFTNSNATVSSSGLYAGGLIGRSYSNVGNSYATGNVNGASRSAGLIGRAFESIIYNCYALGNITGSGNVGGLIGQIAEGSVSNSYSSGNINSSGSYSGGLIAYSFGSPISSCYSRGNVVGVNYSGGLVGYSFSQIENSYAKGDVNGDTYVGGLIGYNSLSLKYSYSTGNVGGESYIGGLIGDSTSIISTSFYDSENITLNLSANNLNYIGNQTWANLTDYLWLMDQGWNFYGVWSLADNEYPYLGGGNADYPLNGSGTSSDPYQVDSCQELDLVRYRLSSNFILTGDINFSECDSSYTSGVGWEPIGDSVTPFTGNFDGQNYTINNLYINRSSSWVGLFGNVGAGNIRNLILTNLSIYGQGSVGGIAGKNSGTIYGLKTYGNITSSVSRAGGLVGYNLGEVSNSYSDCSINANTFGGGLIGYNSGSIFNSSSSSYLSGHLFIGGLVGECYSCTIIFSHYIGEKTNYSLINSSQFLSPSSELYKGYHLTIQNVTNTTGDYLDNVRIRTYDNLGVTHRTVYTNATGWTNESWSVEYKETSSGKTNLTTFVEAKLNGYKKSTKNLGHQTANNETFFSEMIVDNDTPVVNSLSPSSSYVGNINFTFFLFDDSDTNCTLYVNSQPYAIIEGDIDNSTNSQVLTFGTAGTYPWFVSCEDWNGLQTNSSVVDLVLSNPPSGSSEGGWGADSTPIELPSEDTGVEGDSGTSTSGVSTSEIISTSGGSSCVREVSCLEWSECDAAYKIEDLVEGVETIEGEQKRLCKDANGCVNNYYEIQECSIALNIYVKENEWCGRSYLEVYDNSTGELLTRIDDNKDEEIPSVNILFTGAAVQDICESCFDNVQNGDEEGVDCGGSCPECGDLERFSIIDFILQRMVFWG